MLVIYEYYKRQLAASFFYFLTMSQANFRQIWAIDIFHKEETLYFEKPGWKRLTKRQYFYTDSQAKAYEACNIMAKHFRQTHEPPLEKTDIRCDVNPVPNATWPVEEPNAKNDLRLLYLKYFDA